MEIKLFYLPKNDLPCFKHEISTKRLCLQIEDTTRIARKYNWQEVRKQNEVQQQQQ